MKRREFLLAMSAAAVAAQSGKTIRIDTDGMLMVNGERLFIVGSYQLPIATEPWKEMAEAGFNLIHTGANREELDKARAHKMYAWVTLGSIDPAKRAEGEARVRKAVEEFKSHPALLYWETEDEPSYVWKKPREARVGPQRIIDTCKFVKEIDPVHPFYLNHSPTNLVSTLRKYNAGSDIVATDIYPVVPHGIRESYALWEDGRQGDFLNPYISQVGQYADKLRQVGGPSRTALMVLQGFAWEQLREKDKDPKMILYPTQAETRFMAYQAIVHGSNGIVYWGLPYTPPEAPLWGHIKRVASELDQLRVELAARPAPLRLTRSYYDTGHSLDRGIEWIAKPSGNGVVLITVNADSNPVEVTFGGLEGWRRTTRVAEPGEVAIEGGRMRDSFAPFGVHVYRLQPVREFHSRK
jgi:hypothetical protein